MEKGIDYTGILVTFICHDGDGNYVLHKRGTKCRDEHGVWDFGGGGVKFGERLLDAVNREVGEEYGVVPQKIEFLGFDELHREHGNQKTHWIGFRYKVLLDREKVVNNEPDKHDEIGWFKINNLPHPLHSAVEKELIEYKDKL